MMTTTRSINAATFVLAAAILALPGVVAGSLYVNSQDGVSYVSGGVGEERQALEAMSNRFNLKLTMALTTGNFVSDARVRIQDHQGHTVLDTNADGPLLYAQLKPGMYTVTCSLDGKEIQKTAQISSGKQQLFFTWTSE